MGYGKEVTHKPLAGINFHGQPFVGRGTVTSTSFSMHLVIAVSALKMNFLGTSPIKV
jgi:hypothetical protein